MSEKTKKTPDEVIDEAINNGGTLAVLYFDMHGKSPETIKNLMIDFVTRVTKEPGVVFAYGEIDAPIELDDGVYSTSVEVRALTRDVRTLVALCLKYVPAGVEILRPHQIKMDIGNLQNILIDISSYAFNMTNALLRKGFTEEQKRELARRLKKREELGRRLLRKDDAAKDETETKSENGTG